MTDRQFNATLDAHFDRRFSMAYDVENEPEDIDSWYVVGGFPDYEVHAPCRGGSAIVYYLTAREDAESLVAYLNDTHPNHTHRDADPDLSAFNGDDE